jgi:two-component system nitrogen regulation sensor histidine kinase GlnL
VVPLLKTRGVRGAVVRLRAAEGRIDLEALAAGLAHEIKNPLAGLKGAAELMGDELTPESPLRTYTDLIAREASRVDGLVRSLLDLTRPLQLELRAENVHAVSDDVLLLARAYVPAGVQVVRRYDPSLPEPEIDRDAVAQVLLNLVKNAAEAMAGRGGSIVVETGIVQGMKARVRGRLRGVVRVAVLDEGPGLPEGVELFTPFATTKPRGTGLGLVLSRRIAEAHGGRLELRNRRDGSGAEAELVLPI